GAFGNRGAIGQGALGHIYDRHRHDRLRRGRCLGGAVPQQRRRAGGKQCYGDQNNRCNAFYHRSASSPILSEPILSEPTPLTKFSSECDWPSFVTGHSLYLSILYGWVLPGCKLHSQSASWS